MFFDEGKEMFLFILRDLEGFMFSIKNSSLFLMRS